jgi:dTDP-4-amino-4,6-dideoxygalactose transaminase
MVLQIDFEKIKKSRSEIMERLKEQGIGTQYHYIPLYRHPALKAFSNQESHCPEMELYYKRALSFPLYFDLEEEDVSHIVTTLKKLIRK